MGRREVISEEELKPMVLPETTDVIGVAGKVLGFDRTMMKCQDGYTRLCRILAS